MGGSIGVPRSPVRRWRLPIVKRARDPQRGPTGRAGCQPRQASVFDEVVSTGSEGPSENDRGKCENEQVEWGHEKLLTSAVESAGFASAGRGACGVFDIRCGPRLRRLRTSIRMQQR